MIKYLQSLQWFKKANGAKQILYQTSETIQDSSTYGIKLLSPRITKTQPFVFNRKTETRTLL